MVPAGGVQSVERALDLLEALARARGPLGIAELSAATGQPAGTVHRLLATLTARGYATRDSRTRRYALGPAARALGRAGTGAPDVAELAPPFLREVVALCGETTNLAVLDRERAVYVAQAPCARTVRMFTEIGNRVPLHSTGCGKVLLAYQPDEVARAIVARTGLPAHTARTIADPATLWQELAAIRRRGYAVDDEEYEEGVRCFAVPVHGQEQRVIAAISVSGPASRLPGERIHELAPRVADVSAALTAALNQAKG